MSLHQLMESRAAAMMPLSLFSLLFPSCAPVLFLSPAPSLKIGSVGHRERKGLYRSVTDDEPAPLICTSSHHLVRSVQIRAYCSVAFVGGRSISLVGFARFQFFLQR